MKTVIALIVLLIAVLFMQVYMPNRTQEPPSVASLFRQMMSIVEASPGGSRVHYHNVAIGYNTNADLVVDAVPVLRALQVESPPRGVVHESVSSIQDLAELLAHFMIDGSAVERTIIDDDICHTIVKASRGVVGGKEHVGGNAALIAMRMAPLVDVLLAGNLSPSLRSLLPSTVSLLPGSDEPNDKEVHLILEYKKGEKWGHIEAPRANRVIVHCDRTNAELRTMNAFHDAIRIQNSVKDDSTDASTSDSSSSASKKVDLVVLSGFHLLEAQPPSVQHEKLNEALNLIHPSELNASIPVHLELASMGSLDYVELLAKTLISHVNSIGLNEQELGFLYFALTHPQSDFETASMRSVAAAHFVREQFKDPSIERTLTALDSVFVHANSAHPNTLSLRSLERIHFHSLKFHVLATTRSSSWLNTHQAVILGSLAASSNACGFNDQQHPFNTSKVELILPPGSNYDSFATQAVQHSSSSIAHYSISPVLVCSNPLRTVGLGDAISAAGLLHHQFWKQ